MAATYFASLSKENENIHQKYSKLINNEFLSDVTFIIGKEDTRISGHSFVLMLCSWDFYNVFKLVKLDNYEFIIKDVPITSFMAFMEYCYTYTLDLSMDTSLDKTFDILKLSQRFQMKALEQICLRSMSLHLSTMNCMNIFKHRELFSVDSSVLNTAMYHIRDNFMEILQVESNIDIFINLSLEEVLYFEKSQIHCDEKMWFDILMKWAKRSCLKQNLPPLGKNLKMVLGDTFHEISFSDMPANFFLEIIANYPGLFTIKEIIEISRKINGNTADCPGFKYPSQVTYNSDSRIVLFGRTVHFFTGTPKMDQGMTDEMTSKFYITRKIKLRGFAFVAKRNEVVNVTSCKFKNSFTQNCEIITTNSAGRYQVNEEYDLIAIRFEREYTLSRFGVWVYLLCKFDKPVPNLACGRLDTIHVQGISYNVNEKNAIPYLIFSQP